MATSSSCWVRAWYSCTPASRGALAPAARLHPQRARCRQDVWTRAKHGVGWLHRALTYCCPQCTTKFSLYSTCCTRQAGRETALSARSHGFARRQRHDESPLLLGDKQTRSSGKRKDKGVTYSTECKAHLRTYMHNIASGTGGRKRCFGALLLRRLQLLSGAVLIRRLSQLWPLFHGGRITCAGTLRTACSTASVAQSASAWV